MSNNLKVQETLNPKEYCNKLQELTQHYQSTLQNNLEINKKVQESIQTEIETIRDVMNQLELISLRPEWSDSFIPINSMAYIPATIHHTSEFYVKLGMECYTLMCLKEVLSYLERKKNYKEKNLEAYKEHYKQLQERSNVSKNSLETTEETKDMPFEIASEMGMAYKTASGFYEIIEPYDENTEEEFYKKRKLNKFLKKTNEDVNSYGTLNKLKNLEQQENIILEERVKAILENSNVYQQLLNDETVNSYCNALEVDAKQTETLLNNLIIKALLIEPEVYKPND